MILKLKSLTGKIRAFNIDSSSTIKELQQKIFELEQIPAQQQRLVCNGKVLKQTEKTISECQIFSNSTIHLILALRGGK